MSPGPDEAVNAAALVDEAVERLRNLVGATLAAGKLRQLAAVLDPPQKVKRGRPRGPTHPEIDRDLKWLCRRWIYGAEQSGFWDWRKRRDSHNEFGQTWAQFSRMVANDLHHRLGFKRGFAGTPNSITRRMSRMRDTLPIQDHH